MNSTRVLVLFLSLLVAGVGAASPDPKTIPPNKPALMIGVLRCHTEHIFLKANIALPTVAGLVLPKTTDPADIVWCAVDTEEGFPRKSLLFRHGTEYYLMTIDEEGARREYRWTGMSRVEEIFARDKKI